MDWCDGFVRSNEGYAVYQDLVFHSHHSLFSMISRSELERNIGWERQLDFCTGGCTAGDFEQPADSLGPLSHSGEAPVSLSSRIENLWLDSASVVTNPHCKVTVGEFQFKIDALCSGMTKGVEQGLSSKTVNFLLDRRPQRLLLADDTDAKVHTGLSRNFLTNGGQSHNQIQWARVRRTEILNGLPAFVYPLLHELQNWI